MAATLPARWCASERKWKGSKGMSGTELEEHECEKGGWAGREGAGEREGTSGRKRQKRTDRGTSERELEVAEKWRNVDAEKGETKGRRRTGGRIPSRSLSRREKPI